MKRRGVIDQRLLCVFVLALEVSEELHRLDVGVAVDDAAGQRRSHMRELLGPTPDPGNEDSERREIAGDPQGQRTGEPPVGPGKNHQRRDRKDGHEPERVDDLHHRVP